jgi:hypothetical protein
MGRPWLLTTALTVACGTGGDTGDAFTQRDSAGIRIDESRAAAWPESGGWRLSDRPALTIGRIEGEEAYLFSRVAGVRRLSDGRIAVANSASSEVRIFDRAGTHATTIGRAGGGPGEFTALDGLVRLPGDTLVVISSFGNRYSVFDPADSLVEVRFVPFPGRGNRFPDGAWLGLRYAGSVAPATTGFVRDSIVFFRFSPADLTLAEGSRIEGVLNRDAMESFAVDTILTVPGNEEFRQEVVMGTSRGISNSPVAFGRSVSHAVYGSDLAWGDGTTFEVRITGSDGGTKRIIRLLEPNPELTAEAIEAWSTERRSWIRNESQRPRVEEMIAAQTFPDRAPAFSGILLDADGNLWVERYRFATDDPQRWAVFDPDGRYLGTVRTPARFTIHDIGRDWMLGVWLNDEDVEIVHMYDLIRTEDTGDD